MRFQFCVRLLDCDEDRDIWVGRLSTKCTKSGRCARGALERASRKLFGLVLISVQLAFARQGAKEQGENNDDWPRSNDSYSPRRHWCFRSPTISVGPRFAYRRGMTLVSSDDDLDWEFAFDSRVGHPAGSRGLAI
jgi:hypothetical protein